MKKILFYFWFFLVFDFVNNAIDFSSCTSTTPITVKNCTDIKTGDDKVFCCFYSYLFKAKRYLSCTTHEKNLTLIEQHIQLFESNDDYDDVTIDCKSKYIKLTYFHIIVLLIVSL